MLRFQDSLEIVSTFYLIHATLLPSQQLLLISIKHGIYLNEAFNWFLTFQVRLAIFLTIAI